MSQQNTHPFGDDNAVRIIPGPAGILQLAQLHKTSEIREGGHNGEMLTQMFSPKSSGHYLNITLKNMVKVFHKDTSSGIQVLVLVHQGNLIGL
ncbi:hypothetical protein Tco_0978672 [Tanacetum coccineum]|uniref:Uncharacterized protein n=1 Tax=Tanacetum coccineum TaxID=301880 RepID=A0ABQ5ENQ8_9ASTR